MADKNLKIGLKFDSSGVRAVETVLKRLRKEGIETAKALRGIQVETPHGQGLMAKSISQSSDAMNRFNGVTKETAKSMKFILGRQIDEENRRLIQFTRNVDKTNQALDNRRRQLEAVRKGGDKDAIAYFEKSVSRLSGATVGFETGRQNIGGAIRELMADKSVISDIVKAMGIIGSVGTVVSTVASMYQNTKTLGAGNMATVGGFGSGILGGLRNDPMRMGLTLGGQYNIPGLGLVSGAEALKAAGGQKSMLLRDLGITIAGAAGAVGAGAVAFGSAAGAVGSGGIGAPALGPLAYAAGGAALASGGAALEGGRRLWSGLARGGYDAEEASKQAEMLDKLDKLHPYQDQILGNLAQTAGWRMAGSRRLGGSAAALAMASAGTVSGNTGEEAVGFGMGLADRFGSRFANATASDIFALENKGFSKDFSGNFMGQMAAAGMSVGGSKDQMLELLSEGVARGLSHADIQFFEKIGGAVSAAAIGPGGSMGPEGSAQYARSLMSDITEDQLKSGEANRIVDYREQGFSVGDRFSNVPSFRMQRLLDAKKILGPKGNPMQVMALATAPMKALSTGGDDTTRAFGISSEAAMAEFRAGVMTPLDIMIGSGGGSPELKEIRQRLNAAKTPAQLTELMHDPDFQRTTAGLTRILQGSEFNASKGLIQDVAANGEQRLGLPGAGPADSTDTKALELRRHTARQTLELVNAESDQVFKWLEQSATHFKVMMDAFSRIDTQTMQEVANAFDKMATSMSKGGTSSSRPREGQNKVSTP